MVAHYHFAISTQCDLILPARAASHKKKCVRNNIQWKVLDFCITRRLTHDVHEMPLRHRAHKNECPLLNLDHEIRPLAWVERSRQQSPNCLARKMAVAITGRHYVLCDIHGRLDLIQALIHFLRYEGALGKVVMHV